MEVLLDRVVLTPHGAVPQDDPQGEWVWIPNYGYTFVPAYYPLAEEVLATYAKRRLFTTVGVVTGEILTPEVEIDGVRQAWGAGAKVGDRFRVIARGRYHATENLRTRMYLTVYSPTGAVQTWSDSELWPYTAPDTIITFSLPTPSDSPHGVAIESSGEYKAELRYVWVT